jgi:HTH-type transcriptional regulator/antitoxin MqsA
MSQEKCANCGASELQFLTEAETFDYKGQSLTVDVDYSICAQCGAEAILPEQIKRNDGRVRNAWRKADGLLSGAEISALRKKLGLTQQDAAKVFGGGVNAFSKYERGEVIQSEGMDKLMRLALEERPVHAYHWLRERVGLSIATENNYGSEVFQLFEVKYLPLKMESANEVFSEITDDYRDANYG